MSLKLTVLALAVGDDGGDDDRVDGPAGGVVGASENPRPGDPMYNPRLADGTPLSHAFYPDSNPPVVSTLLGQWARGLFRRLVAKNPDVLVACEGKTLAEARAILVDAGVNGVPRITKQVTVSGPGRFRIELNVTGITPLSSSISIFERHGGRCQRLGCATCYILGGSGDGEAIYFDLPPAASIRVNVGLRDPNGPAFIKVDRKTLEPDGSGGGGSDHPGDVQSGVSGEVRDCCDVRKN